MQVFSNKVRDGKYSLQSVTIVSDEGLQVYIGGGEKAHIGSVAVSQPRESLTGDGSRSCTTSVINLVGHKDDAVSLTSAEAICRFVNKVVVITAGVHITGAGSKDIEWVLRNVQQINASIIRKLEELGLQPEEKNV